MSETASKVTAALETMRAGVARLQSGEDWKRYLAVQARFHRYSFRNVLLILMQHPDASRVAGFKTWLGLGRHVRKGEKGIQILAPAGIGRRVVELEDGTTREHAWTRYRVAYVFDIAQTDGEPLPEIACAPVGESEFASSVDRLREVALGLPDQVVSRIEVRPRRAGDHPTAAGWYERATRAIVVIEEGSRAAQFAVLAHELGHAILHGAGDHHSAPVREVEAESVAFVVCSALGLDTAGSSFPYVATWAGCEDAAKAIQASGERIARAARLILDALLDEAPAAAEAEAA